MIDKNFQIFGEYISSYNQGITFDSFQFYHSELLNESKCRFVDLLILYGYKSAQFRKIAN